VKNINAKQVAGYLLLPGIIPRLRDFSSSGFGFLAILLANLYVMLRILPHTHPYNNPDNIGKFGMRHVIAEAANNIVISRNNIDQIAIFLVSVSALLLLIFQCIMLFFGLFIQPAAALGGWSGSLFATPNPTDDIAFNILDMVFGVPDFFCNPAGTCSAINGELPWPFHSALHTMFEFYSIAVLLLGVIIFLYYVVVVIGETAISGTPFGRRFSHIYAPLRLVAAVGLLIPLNYGFNSAQYITLAAAKYGSSLATNGWLEFNRVLADKMDNPQPTGQDAEYLTAHPEPPDIEALVSFMSLVSTCRGMYKEIYDVEINPYLVKFPTKSKFATTTAYEDALDFYGKGDIIIRFGQKRSEFKDFKGSVKPYCGEILVHTNTLEEPGSYYLQEQYYNRVLLLWANSELFYFGLRMTYIHDLVARTDPCSIKLSPDNKDCKKPPIHQWLQERIIEHQGNFESDIHNAWEELKDSSEWVINEEVLKRGWGGAGIWYNKIAQYNGSLFGAARKVPSPNKYPVVMEEVLDARRANDLDVSGLNAFLPNLSEEQDINFLEADDHVASGLYETFKYLLGDDMNQASSDSASDSNIFFKTMNVIFGTYGILTIRDDKNINVHPLAQLASAGKGLVDSSISTLAYAIGFAAGGGLFSAMNYQLGGQAMNAFSGMLLSISMIGLVAGFILYYVIPFMPFIYFFFAVGGWVKTVFEAMVGVPLWALAHLRIDGDGFPGEMATNGYFLIFEVFVRPILCVFGLLAGIAIFAAQARVLHDIFDLVILNLTGFQEADPKVHVIGDLAFKRHAVDEFFFTITYVVILYLMATASFKLIDMIPNSILRWMGAGVQTFSDNREDPTQYMIRYAAIGGAQIGGQVAGGLQQAGQLAGSGLGRVVSGMGMGAAREGGQASGGSTPP
jgi:conjugal transfer/type IV secretion protein DotA/TraY